MQDLPLAADESAVRRLMIHGSVERAGVEPVCCMVRKAKPWHRPRTRPTLPCPIRFDHAESMGETMARWGLMAKAGKQDTETKGGIDDEHFKRAIRRLLDSRPMPRVTSKKAKPVAKATRKVPKD